jgi:DNA-binding response OmpR family regulator
MAGSEHEESEAEAGPASSDRFREDTHGSGLDLLRRLRSMGPVKAIALSGFGSEKDVLACKEAGFDEHLTKPVTIDILTRTIESLMAHAEARSAREHPRRKGGQLP